MTQRQNTQHKDESSFISGMLHNLGRQWAEEDKVRAKKIPESQTESTGSPTVSEVRCQSCRKPLTLLKSIERGMGAECYAKYTNGILSAYANRASLQVDEVPPKHITFSSASEYYKERGVPVKRLLRACGGNGGVNEPLSDDFRMVFHRNIRYIPASSLMPYNIDAVLYL